MSKKTWEQKHIENYKQREELNQKAEMLGIETLSQPETSADDNASEASKTPERKQQ